MSAPPFVSAAAAEPLLDWIAVSDAIADGHRLPRAQIDDSFLYRGAETMLLRAAWIDGLGLAVKTATVFPGNAAAGRPAVNGGLSLYSDADATLDALVDFHLVTRWKTAADSLLAARRLARPGSRRVLILGAGTVARSLRAAYGAGFPDASFEIWNRSPDGAGALAGGWPATRAVTDLEAAVRRADVIATATMAVAPLVRGAWLRPGQHLDLLGAYRPDMREADDAAITAGRLFVDSRKTTLAHIGELAIPLESGVISEGDVVADFYDEGAFARRSDDEITVFKNGGGAHMDLMVARHVLERWQAAGAPG